MTLFRTLRWSQVFTQNRKDMWDRACKAARVDDAHLHDLRAKAITAVNRQGKNAQALGGHATEAMTKRYIRARDTIFATPPSLRQSSTN